MKLLDTLWAILTDTWCDHSDFETLREFDVWKMTHWPYSVYLTDTGEAPPRSNLYTRVGAEYHILCRDCGQIVKKRVG